MKHRRRVFCLSVEGFSDGPIRQERRVPDDKPRSHALRRSAARGPYRVPPPPGGAHGPEGRQGCLRSGEVCQGPTSSRAERVDARAIGLRFRSWLLREGQRPGAHAIRLRRNGRRWSALGAGLPRPWERENAPPALVSQVGRSASSTMRCLTADSHTHWHPRWPAGVRSGQENTRLPSLWADRLAGPLARDAWPWYTIERSLAVPCPPHAGRRSRVTRVLCGFDSRPRRVPRLLLRMGGSPRFGYPPPQILGKPGGPRSESHLSSAHPTSCAGSSGRDTRSHA